MDYLFEFIWNNVMLFIAISVIIIWIIINEITYLLNNILSIKNSEATRLYNNEDAVFVDISSKSEYYKGHLPGTINIPYCNIMQIYNALKKYKHQPIIIYCTDGTYSIKISKQLKKKGFERMYHLKGGKNAWKLAGLPLESK